MIVTSTIGEPQDDPSQTFHAFADTGDNRSASVQASCMLFDVITTTHLLLVSRPMQTWESPRQRYKVVPLETSSVGTYIPLRGPPVQDFVFNVTGNLNCDTIDFLEVLKSMRQNIPWTVVRQVSPAQIQYQFLEYRRIRSLCLGNWRRESALQPKCTPKYPEIRMSISQDMS